MYLRGDYKMKTMNLSTLRKDIYNLFDEVIEGGEVIEIVLKGGKKAFVVSNDDYNQLTENYNKSYYDKINESLKEAEKGEVKHLSIQELERQLLKEG